MGLGRHVAAVLFATLTAVSMRPADAQVAPGVRPPANIAEGVLMAELFGCLSAASGRPANGLNIPPDKDQRGVALHEALPAALAAKVGILGARARFMSLDTPEGAVWMAFDPDVRACTVTAIATDPSAIREKLMSFFESGRSPWHRVTGVSSLPVYEWAVRATPQLGTPAVQLRATLNIPGQAGQQAVIVTQAIHTD